MAGSAALLLLLLAPAATGVDFGTEPARRVSLLRHEHPGVRRQAALLLANAPAERALVGLLLALDDPATGVREAAAGALASIGDGRAVPNLLARLRQERSPRVLVALLAALARCGDRYLARDVALFLDHPARPVRAAAAYGLGALGDAGQRDALWAALHYAPDDPDFLVRSAVLGAFVALGWAPEAREAIVEIEQGGGLRSWRARAAVVSAVGLLELTERAAWLGTLVREDEDPRVVAAAAEALARIGRRDEVHAALEHEAPQVRRAALVALQECGDERAVARALEMVRDDPDVNVRFEAALVLHYADRPEADVYLVDALRARDPLLWISALGALERRYDRSFGRDPEAWASFLRHSRAPARVDAALGTAAAHR